jgi:hypothetical protein
MTVGPDQYGPGWSNAIQLTEVGFRDQITGGANDISGKLGTTLLAHSAGGLYPLGAAEACQEYESIEKQYGRNALSAAANP